MRQLNISGVDTLVIDNFFCKPFLDSRLAHLPFSKEYVLFSPVGFEGNLSLLQMCFVFLLQGTDANLSTYRGPLDVSLAAGRVIRQPGRRFMPLQ